MSNGYMWLKLGQLKAADLQKEAKEHRMASSFRPERPSWLAARVLAGAWVTILGGVLLLLAR
ncbi:MAG TPA: hypothetical protein VJJ46_03360 [Anaerolineales bacterium]|nr:hypothetical protein [Anaerolineales bacterium]